MNYGGITLELHIGITQDDGNQLLYKEIWNVKVPSKVCIFSWRLSQDGLATHANRKRRMPTRDATCQICGRQDESGYHTVVSCTKAACLRYEMRKIWILSDEEHVRYTCPDWLLMLLRSFAAEAKAYTLLLLW
jgi:hypothetical protein